MASPGGEYCFTAGTDGVLVKWETQFTKKCVATPIWHTCDHMRDIVSIDVKQDLNIFLTASLDGFIVLRELSTNKFIRRIQIPLPSNDTQDFQSEMAHKSPYKHYSIIMGRISSRRYIVTVLRCNKSLEKGKDIIYVCSINGEFICAKETTTFINAVLFEETEYQFLTGCAEGLVIIYDLLTLSCKTVFDYAVFLQKSILKSFIPESVTSIELTKPGKGQQLFIGLSNGELYSMRCNPKSDKK